MKVVELAIELNDDELAIKLNDEKMPIELNDDPGHRFEYFDLVALPFIPRIGEMFLWNYKSYLVTNVLYAFKTDPADYNFDASSTTQSLVAHDLCYKVYLKSC
ncbi:hypothetical protein [Paenibacillus graminis]|uniref:hypothetical protein n=1 Tax=Paenibacillus graminis TaxID=189425 RepID=UPI000F9F0383|nr:hypothetical protein [Paenibacillus graminis]MEC0167077.1 hypothetical protein [Paenibacillus graminis]